MLIFCSPVKKHLMHHFSLDNVPFWLNVFVFNLTQSSWSIQNGKKNLRKRKPFSNEFFLNFSFVLVLRISSKSRKVPSCRRLITFGICFHLLIFGLIKILRLIFLSKRKLIDIYQFLHFTFLIHQNWTLIFFLFFFIWLIVCGEILNWRNGQ